MTNNLFESAKFNMGWELSSEIILFGIVFPITISADAYYEHEKATQQQNDAYQSFIDNKKEILNRIENILIGEAGNLEDAKNRFKPAMLVIRTNGDYGMLFDDKNDFENGTVVCIKPDFVVTTSDEYL